FAKVCANMKSLKCKAVEFIGSYYKIKLRGIANGGICAKTEEFESQIPEDFDIPEFQNLSINEEINVKVNKTIYSALAKLNNICPNGNIKIYMEKDLPLRLKCNIGTYGKISIYIKDDPELA